MAAVERGEVAGRDLHLFRALPHIHDIEVDIGSDIEDGVPVCEAACAEGLDFGFQVDVSEFLCVFLVEVESEIRGHPDSTEVILGQGSNGVVHQGFPVCVVGHEGVEFIPVEIVQPMYRSEPHVSLAVFQE